MGATTFFTMESREKHPDTAFAAAKKQAQYDHGHAGYTGTIAEKTSFTIIKEAYQLPTGKPRMMLARQLINDSDPRIDDKWGPAGCIEVEPGQFLFFGWASE